jgi:F-type H+-transporting ATPase subunit gamma
MEQLSNLKKHIGSIGEIKKTTRAMQLISAVKMRRARSQLEKTMPFFALCAGTMVELRDAGVVIDNTFFQLRNKKRGQLWKIGYFILTGDQGLAGAYNMNVLSAAEKHIHSKVVDNITKGMVTTTKLYMAGSIGRERLIREGFDVVEDFQYPINEPTYYRARDISEFILELYESGTLDLVYFVYTRMESAVSMKPFVTRVLPVNPDALELIIPEKYRQKRGLISGSIIDYSPSPDEVITYLIDTYMNGMVYGALTEAYASEQTARMTAMDNATENAEDMLHALTLKNNQARQAKITSELSEIIGGAEALTSHQAKGKTEG